MFKYTSTYYIQIDLTGNVWILGTYIYKMVAVFGFGFDDSFDVTQGLQQIEIHDLLHQCAPCSELPSNISNMDGSGHLSVPHNINWLM